MDAALQGVTTTVEMLLRTDLAEGSVTGRFDIRAGECRNQLCLSRRLSDGRQLRHRLGRRLAG